MTYGELQSEGDEDLSAGGVGRAQEYHAVGDHQAILRIGQPQELHRPRQSQRSIPGRAAVVRRNVAYEEPTSRLRATALRVEVVVNRNVRAGARGCRIDTDSVTKR